MASGGGNPPIIPFIMIAVGSVLIYSAVKNKQPGQAFRDLFGQTANATATPTNKPGAPGSPVYGPAIPTPGGPGSPIYGPPIPNTN